MIGFTQSSYPAFLQPSDEDYKTLWFSNSRAKGGTYFSSIPIFMFSFTGKTTKHEHYLPPYHSFEGKHTANERQPISLSLL